MERQRQEYLAFMVRCWRVGDSPATGQITNWRASLESPHTGERIGFGSLAELFIFLVEEVMRCETGNMPPAEGIKQDV